MSKDKKRLVPVRRFKEFENAPAWEQRKLGEVGKTFTGLSGKTKEDFGHGDACFVTYMNVYSNPISDLNMVENVEIDTKQQEVKKGDVFFTTSSETPEEVGMSSVWLGDEPHIYLNSFCFGFRPTGNMFNPYYLAYLLRSNNIRNKMMILAQGISRYNISKNKVMKLDITIPNIREQQKIGEFFKQLDSLIALHQRKLDKLKRVKSAYLTEMFPAEGEREPKRRFPGFTGAWEQRKLGDTVNSIVAGGDIDKSKIQENGKYPVYANALTNDGVIGYYNDQYRVKAPAVTVTGRGEIGVAKTRNTNFTPVVRLLAINSMHNNYFLENLINTHRAFAESTGVPQLTAPQLANYKLKFPKSIEEESKIGNFFNNLDSLITLHQRKPNSLSF